MTLSKTTRKLIKLKYYPITVICDGIEFKIHRDYLVQAYKYYYMRHNGTEEDITTALQVIKLESIGRMLLLSFRLY